jgi:TatD DNase family protein
MKLLDSHAHLDMLKQPQAALERARAVGVIQIVSIGIDLESSRAAARLAAENEDVFFTAGLHPHDAEQESPSLWKDMETLARGQGAVAVGECGLDFSATARPGPCSAGRFSAKSSW